MKRKVVILLSLASVLTLFSCARENNVTDPETSQPGQETALRDFAEILSSAVYSEPALRDFIKSEALKEFDKDHDVFYPFVKDEIVSDGQTFSQILKKYDTKNLLQEIEAGEPLLNILVPDWSWIDEGCFSVYNWDTGKEEVAVTYHGLGSNLTLFGNGNIIATMKGNEFPSLPVLIVKRNERMVCHPVKGAGLEYDFFDPAFDGNSHVTKGTWYEHTYEFSTTQPDDYVLNSYFPEKVKLAYFESVSAPAMAQRDYIYYGMNGSVDQGQVDFHYKERLYKFRFHSGYVSALSDDTTPGNNDIAWSTAASPGTALSDEDMKRFCWTSGAPELVFHIISGSEEITKTKSVAASDAFMTKKVHFQWYQNLFGTVTYRKYWVNPEDLVPKWIMADWDLFTWDLKDYPKKYKVSVEEIDTGTQTTIVDTNTYRYATNITTTYEGGSQQNTKIGYGYGVTNETTHQHSVTYSSVSNSDNLGSAWVEYTDPIITNYPNPVAKIYCYSTGLVDFMIIPSQTY